MSFNTPNMSYCAAENTMLAVQQLIELIDGGYKNDVDKGGREWHAIHDLVHLCDELQNSLEDLVQDLERRDENYVNEWYDEDNR